MKTKMDVLQALDMQIDMLEKKLQSLLDEGAGAQELARHYVAVRDVYDRLGTINNRLSDFKNRLAYEVIPTAFEKDGISTMTLKEGFRVTVQGLVRASTRNMERGIKWLDENGLGEIAKRTINAQTLAALAKDLMGQGRELPDEVFNVHFGSNTSITKVK
jgi:hypothetical protein